MCQTGKATTAPARMGKGRQREAAANIRLTLAIAKRTRKASGRDPPKGKTRNTAAQHESEKGKARSPANVHGAASCPNRRKRGIASPKPPEKNSASAMKPPVVCAKKN